MTETETPNAVAPRRNARGHWLPGQSANPAGRPAASYRLADLARTHSEDMLKVLVEVAKDDTAPPAARVSAAQAVLDRAHGKPMQSQELKIEGTFDPSALHLAALRQLAEIEPGAVIDVTPSEREDS